MVSKYPRGSEWRKWDLHVHTPESFHWKGGKRFPDMSDEEASTEIKAILDKINSSDVAVVAIVDYWTFDGYTRIRNYLESNPHDLDDGKLILPGMEVRIEAPVDYRLNMQVILSNELTDQDLQDFKNELKIRNINRRISYEALIQLARSFSPDKANSHGHPDYKEDVSSALLLGSKTAEITKDSFENALRALPSRDKCLVVMPFDTSDGLVDLDWEKHPQPANYYLQMPDIFESRKQETKDFFNGIKTDKNEKFFDNFFESLGGKPKPVICGSDAHRVTDYGDFPGNKSTWIKANPTYNGLRQVLIEPEQRVYIGDIPPQIKRLNEDSTKFAESIFIKKTAGSSLTEKWFDAELGMNPGLIAVIGKKGSGKSALADIFALLGNTSRYTEFSFLKRDRFRDTKLGIAQSYDATLIWSSGTSNGPIPLSDNPDPSDVERVSYIPQSYLEKVCNEVNTGRNSIFNNEIEEVIFSHIPESERYSCHSLRELIKLKTEERERSIDLIKDKLSKINYEISDLRVKNNASYKLRVTKEYEAVLSDIKSLWTTGRPTKVPKPIEDAENAEQIQELGKKLEKLKKRQNQLIRRKEYYAEVKKESLIILEKARKLRGRINNLKEEFSESKKSAENLCMDLGLDIEELVKLQINDKQLLALEEAESNKLSKCEQRLNSDQDNSFINKLKPIDKQIRLLNEELSEPQRLYEAYLTDWKEWRERIRTLLGDVENPKSARGLKKVLKDLEQLPVEIDKLVAQRLELVKEIYEEKRQLKETYTNLHAPVEDFIGSFAETELENQLTFSANIMESNFVDKLLSNIHQGRVGSFSGVKEGRKVANQLTEESEFGEWEGVTSFLDKIEDLLSKDRRPGAANASVKIEDQLMESVTPIDLDNFLYGLDYIEPEFEIGWAGKRISQLSPGEKGNLLLIFYLLIDRADIPLIIDQPEENLDNETVFKTLVPCVKEARKRRQVMLVTHNPNLAVACDADQVIHASIDKADGNAITYTCGAIEDLEINKLLVDVLEGTRPAFEARDAKYEISRI